MRSCEDYVVERLEMLEMVNDGLTQTIKDLRKELEEMRAVGMRRTDDMVRLLEMFDTGIFIEPSDNKSEEKFTLNMYQTIHTKNGVTDDDWNFLAHLFTKYGVERGRVEDGKKVCCTGCSCSESKTENN